MKRKRVAKPRREITDYDGVETSTMINRLRPLQFRDLDLVLPQIPPTQVVSIRLPSGLLNEIRALSSQRDIPYQALIKAFLARSVEEAKETKRSK